MSKIGFRHNSEASAENQQVGIFDEVETMPHINADEILKIRGRQLALSVLLEYLDNSLPFVERDNYDKIYIQRLRKIKERYFDKI